MIVGLVVAFFLASRYHTTVAEMSFLRSVRERSEDVALVGSFLGILFVVAAVGSIIPRPPGAGIVAAAAADGCGCCC